MIMHKTTQKKKKKEFRFSSLFCLKTWNFLPFSLQKIGPINYTGRYLWARKKNFLKWVGALAPQVEGWVFKSQSWQTLVVKTGSDSSTAKRSAIGVGVTDLRRWQLWMDAPCHSRCGTLINSHCSMAMIAEHRSKFAALNR